MFAINKDGHIQDARIKPAIAPSIERGPLKVVNGIIVHQTDSPTAAATLNGYRQTAPNGAHFLIDKDGTVYQTASLYKITFHVGWIKSRCIAEHRCSPVEMKALQGKKPGAAVGQIELKKPWPQRFPYNADSLGIELVGDALPKNAASDARTFETVTAQQQASLKWLVAELMATFGVKSTEVFRHYEVSWKNLTEAKTAAW
jgi:N-acetyl-anhydromuramyl-L-alanine amidase AmpD